MPPVHNGHFLLVPWVVVIYKLYCVCVCVCVCVRVLCLIFLFHFFYKSFWLYLSFFEIFNSFSFSFIRIVYILILKNSFFLPFFILSFSQNARAHLFLYSLFVSIILSFSISVFILTLFFFFFFSFIQIFFLFLIYIFLALLKNICICCTHPQFCQHNNILDIFLSIWT